jgi:hypothetical protein
VAGGHDRRTVSPAVAKEQAGRPAAARDGPPRVSPAAAALLQLQRDAGNRAVTSLLERDAEAQAGRAAPVTPPPRSGSLPPDAVPPLERVLGGSLAGVRVHAGLVGETGLAIGGDVHLAPGAARHTLAHELAHVVQQRALGLAFAQAQSGRAPAPEPAAPDPLAAYPDLLLALTPAEARVLRRLLARAQAAELRENPFVAAPGAAERLERLAGAGPAADRVSVPVERVLAPELRLPEPPQLGDALLPVIALDEPSPEAAGGVIAREALRRFMAEYWSPALPVELTAVTGGIRYLLGERGVDSSDGLLHLDQLLGLVAAGRLEGLVRDVAAEAERLAPIAARYVAARHAVSGMRSLVRRIGEVPELYALQPITEQRDRLTQAAHELATERDASIGPAWDAQLTLAAQQLSGAVGLLDGAIAGLQAFHARTATQETSEERFRSRLAIAQAGMRQGGFFASAGAGEASWAAGLGAQGDVVADLVSGGAVSDHDRTILDYRGGRISYDQYETLTTYQTWRAGIALVLSLAAGYAGGALVAGIGGRVFMATIGGRMLAGAVGGGLGGLAFVGGQDLAGSAFAATDDLLVRRRILGQMHGPGDYALATALGGGLGAGLAGLGGLVAGRTPPPVPDLPTPLLPPPPADLPTPLLPPPPAPGEPVMLYDWADRPALYQGGAEVPAQPGLPLVLGPGGRPPPSPYRTVRVFTPEGDAYYFPPGAAPFRASGPTPLYVRPGFAAGVQGGRPPVAALGVPVYGSPTEVSWSFGATRIGLPEPTPLWASPGESGLYLGGRRLTAPYVAPQVPQNQAWRAAAAFVRRNEWALNAANWNMTPAEYAAQADMQVARLVQGAEVRVRAPVAALTEIVRTGRLLNQFETGTTGGLLDLNARRSVEAGLWATPPEAGGAQRPVYGYLSGTLEATPAQYGDAVLRLRPAVRARTTFTFGDSLDETALGMRARVAGEPLTRPTALAAQTGTDPLALGSLADVESGGYSTYTEAQVHGGVTLADVQEVVFTNGVIPSPQVRAALESAGIPWRIVAGPAP